MIGIIADVHLACHRQLGGASSVGLNVRAREILAVLQRAGQLVMQADPQARLVIAGDLFDTARPSPQLMAGALVALDGMPVTAIVGNHDQVSAQPGDHALGPLGYARGWVTLDGPDCLDGVAYLPFERATTRTTLDRLDELLTAHPGTQLAILHAGIDDGSAPSWLRGSMGSVALEELAQLASSHGVQAVVSGDWHVQQSWTRHGVQVAQVGALVPTGWDNPGLDGYGGLVTWDGCELRTYQLPGPRFLAATSVEHAASLLSDPRASQLRLSVTSPLEELASTELALQELARTHPGLLGWRVVPDGRKLTQETLQAVQAAQTTTNQADRLVAYVAECPLPEGVDRGQVVSMCQAALATGAK